MCLFSLFQTAFRALASREAALDRSHVRGALSYAISGPRSTTESNSGRPALAPARGFEIAGARCMQTKHNRADPSAAVGAEAGVRAGTYNKAQLADRSQEGMT